MDVPAPDDPPPSSAARGAEPREAAPARTADSPPRPVPLNFTGYCLGCSYNLRGLSEPRCPECGRAFRPAAPSSYSLTPRGRSAALLQFVEAARGKGRGHLPWTVSRRVLWLDGRVRELAARNAELESMLAALIDLLVARGVVRPEELGDSMQPGVVPPPERPNDPPRGPPEDEPTVPLSEEPDLETAALRELLRAAQRRAAEGQQGGAP